MQLVLAGSGTEAYISSTKENKQKEHVNRISSQDRKITSSKSPKTQSTPSNVVKTANKYISLSSDVEHMEEDSPPPRSRRSVSRSRRKSGNISPVKYKK